MGGILVGVWRLRSGCRAFCKFFSLFKDSISSDAEKGANGKKSLCKNFSSHRKLEEKNGIFTFVAFGRKEGGGEGGSEKTGISLSGWVTNLREQHSRGHPA